MVIPSQHVASSKCYFSVVIVGSVKSRATENNKGCSLTRWLCHADQPQHGRNSCHGCRCLGDMTVRVCKGLAIPPSCVIWLVQIASVRVYTPAGCFPDCFYGLVPIPRSQMSSSTDNSGRWGQLLLSQNGIPFLLQSLTLGVSYGLRID